MKIKQRQIVVGTKLPEAPSPLPPSKELLRVRLRRIMDDGTQTLGIMDVLNTDEQTVMYSLATVELPYKGNQPKISCIPVDNYRVVSYATGKWGNCFWLIANEGGDYIENRIAGNDYTRGSILIHMAPKVTNTLQGCIGPGLKFNAQTNQKGNQKGTGMYYLSPSKEQSKQAMNKLVNTLWNIGSFKMEIVGEFANEGEAFLNGYDLQNSFNSRVISQAQQANLLPNPYIAPK
tara:strand:+ start:3028 stop:3726 length:699 start_codon:yes stop_codon:yes gene_type:complete